MAPASTRRCWIRPSGANGENDMSETTSDDDSFNDEVLDQLATVRESGYCNMVDQPCVKSAARQIGFDELVEFINEASAAEYMAHLEEMGERDTR